MVSHEYTCCEHNCYVYFRKPDDSSYIYLTLYADDMLIIAKDKSYISKVKELLSKEFEMKDLGATKRSLEWRFTEIGKSASCGSHKRII